MTSPGEFQLPHVTKEQFTDVMRRFAASVNVVTSADGEQKNGMTATAVCSVTAEPPSALIIVNRSNRSYGTIARTKKFAVNVLANDQRHLAAHFASKFPKPFSDVPHRSGTTGCPLIEGADAHIECVVIQEVDVGTHTIFVGKIVATGKSNRAPLLYHEGQYHALAERTHQALSMFQSKLSDTAAVPEGCSPGTDRASAVPKIADNLLMLLQKRALNLRQLFWRAHRALNHRIAEKFVERGHLGIKPQHLTVLSNMNLGETPLAALAERAQMSPEGVTSIAEELERIGYLQHYKEIDAFNFTDAGWELMLTSFNILREIEAEYDAKLNKGDVEQLRRIFGTLYG
jgi:flavin reductase (DIM6/NTAB) family NADH-FMN oxidoreductase RutF/DNA-binding MarR family transcriptional regulator